MFAGGVTNSKRIRNQAEAYPSGLDVFRYLVDKILTTKHEGWIHFDGPQKDAWVEVGNEPDHLVLLFCYTFKSDLNKAFFEACVSIPGNWQLKKFSQRRLGGLLGGSAMFSVPREQIAELICFIDSLFVKFYGCGQDYKVSGYSVNA